MPTKIVRPLKDVDNTALLNAIRRDASLEYRQRVPEITDGKIQKTIESIMEFQGIKNEMLDSLINRIGRVIARNNAITDSPTCLLRFLQTRSCSLPLIR